MLQAVDEREHLVALRLRQPRDRDARGARHHLRNLLRPDLRARGANAAFNGPSGMP